MFVKNLLLALTSYIKALRYLPRLWKYLLFAVFLLLIFALPVYLADSFFEWLLSFIPWPFIHSSEKLFISFMASFSGFVLLLILSPVFSLVSEEVYEILSGEKNPFSLRQLIKDIMRGIKITLRNLIYEYAFILLLSLIVFILPQNKIIEEVALVLNMLVTSYFYGFTLLDYAMENRKMGYRQSVEFVRGHPEVAIGLGMIYYGMLKITGWTSAFRLAGDYTLYWNSFGEALVAFIGVIAGTLALHKLINKKE